MAIPESVFGRLQAQTDAAAIDWLSTIAACEEGFLMGKLPARYVFLYLSSAPKTSRIFADKRCKWAALPVIDGCPFPFWRSRRQLRCWLRSYPQCGGGYR